MRFWLREAERRPNPEPARTDAQKALVAGTLAWVAMLALALIFSPTLASAGLEWLVALAAIGAALGLIGIVAVRAIRRRRARTNGTDPDLGAQND